MRRLHKEIILCEHCRESMMDREQGEPETSPTQSVVSLVLQAFPNASVSKDEHGTVTVDLR